MAEPLQSFNPSSGELIWSGWAGNAAEAVGRARAAFPQWARRPYVERAAIARGFADAVASRSEQMAELISRETGKPLWEARTEVSSVINKVEISITAREERAGERKSSLNGIDQIVRHKPHGVLAVIGPYNFPAHLPNGHIVPALLAGNTVVFKPSGLTPAVGEFLVDCWYDAGLPRGVLEFVPGTGATSRAVASAPGIDGLLFTGSSETGLALSKQFSETPEKILALEMGGNNPLIVWDTDLLDHSAIASLIVQSAYLSSGQRCTAARRLIVSTDEYDSIMEALTSLIDRIIIGGPFDDPQPFMGPVIDNRAAAQLLAGYQRLLGRGARPLRELTRLFDDRPFLTPALIDVTEIKEREDREYFGPLLQVSRAESFDDAIAEANRTGYGLAAGLIGGSRELFDRFWIESRAGVVNWNRPTGGAASNAPFGGVGSSGNHRPSAYYAADYCAWPVATLEAGSPEGRIAVGLRN